MAMTAGGLQRPAPETPWVEPGPSPTRPADGGSDWLDTFINLLPPAVWATLTAATLAATLIALPILRRRAYKAGARTAGRTTPTSRSDRRDQALFIAAMIPAFVTLAAVLIGNGRGLIDFGRGRLGWADGWEYLVPATLDGVGLAFAFLAFRAIRKRRDPSRSVRIAWGAAIASAIIQLGQETDGGSLLAGGYLALLSIFVMLIFHELLDQFVEGTEWIRRDNPAFKLRWLTWPTNTACAWVAWRNYPPADGTPATVKAAVEHLEQVRAAKRAKRRAWAAENADMTAPWWSHLAPWVRVRQLTDVLAHTRGALGRIEEQYLAAEQEAADLTDRLTKLESAFTTTLAAAEQETHRLTAELSAAVTERDLTAQRLTELENNLTAQMASARAEMDKLTAEHEQTLTKLTTEHTEQLTKLLAETRTVNLTNFRQARTGDASPHRDTAPVTRTGDGSPHRRTAPVTPGKGWLTDEQAAEKCLAVNGDPNYVWTQAEIRRVAKIGFSRTARVLDVITELHRKRRQQEAAAVSHTGEPVTAAGEPADPVTVTAEHTGEPGEPVREVLSGDALTAVG